MTAESGRRAARPAGRAASAAAGAGRSSGPSRRSRTGVRPPAIAGRDPGPGGAAGGRGDRRHPRRRQPRRPLGLLRRDALPHRGDAARPGDQRGRPRARRDADRRRRRGRLLDSDPRRRGGGAARLRAPRAAGCGAAPPRCDAAAEGAVGVRTPAPRRAARVDRRGPCAGSGSALNQKTREIRAAAERRPARATLLPAPDRLSSSSGPAGAGRGGRDPKPPRRRCAGPRWRCAPTTPSGPWSAATRWRRAPTASR